jgi:hypothetical protein
MMKKSRQEKMAPTQPPEHPTVARRANTALIISCIAVFITALVVIFSYLQLGVMKKQLEVTDRPWIKVTGIDIDVLEFLGRDFKPFPPFGEWAHAQPDHLWGNFSINIKNVGHSVATQINVQSQLIAPHWQNGYSDVVKDELQKFCLTLAQQEDASHDSNTILFPDESYAAGNGSSVLVDNDHINHGEQGDFIVLALVGCVDYQFSSSAKHHQTTFVYEFFRAQDRLRWFPIGENHAPKDILAIRNESDDYAN